MKLLQGVALEDEGVQSEDEQEIVIYAKIGNPEGLKSASHLESQVQGQLKSPTKGSIRVRKTTDGDAVSYVETIKLPAASSGIAASNKEVSKTIEQEFYSAFMQLTDVHMDKDRFTFVSESVTVSIKTKTGDVSITLPSLKYEVDVFKNDEGGYHEWCKIDVEVQNALAYLKEHHPELGGTHFIMKISHLPFEPKEAFIWDKTDENQKQLLDKLFSEQFLKSSSGKQFE